MASWQGDLLNDAQRHHVRFFPGMKKSGDTPLMLPAPTARRVPTETGFKLRVGSELTTIERLPVCNLWRLCLERVGAPLHEANPFGNHSRFQVVTRTLVGSGDSPRAGPTTKAVSRASKARFVNVAPVIP